MKLQTKKYLVGCAVLGGLTLLLVLILELGTAGVGHAARQANQNVVFYGLCIDQDGNPIEGVSVNARLSKQRRSVVAALITGEFKYYVELAAQTDRSGRFEIKDNGSYLLLERIQREGYLPARGPDSFGFAFGQILYGSAMAGMHQAVIDDPVVFTLWKKGEGSATIDAKRRRTYHADVGLKPEDLAREHFFDLGEGVRKEGPSPRTVTITAQNDGHRRWDSSSNRIIGEPTRAWSFEFSIPKGGLVETEDLFLFRPPESGFEETFRYATKKGWDGFSYQIEDRKFYFRTTDGNFGAFVLRVDAPSDGGMGFRFSEIYFNPEGERNLEFLK